ncbi:hypothetical protein LJR219_001301 [Phenylobacterium sp. LjRoot219]|uniref:hypothetical protein n=1 Tax=Phenylobacterium sp. LjRoot219 TaxID=3342283 RepID=UPI003ED003F0
MGARLNWLAAEGADAASLLARLGLVESGTASDEYSSALACARFPGGWLVLVCAGTGLDLDEALRLASMDGLSLGCEIEEHVMFSRLRAFQGGALTWAVTHDPDAAIHGLAQEGEPPPPFADIRAALAARQADEAERVDHMFEAPIRLGEALCGYRHDASHQVVWTILERRARTRAGTGAARSPRRIESELTTRLLEVFTSDLEPTLRACGWALEEEDSGFRQGAWWFYRLREGRRQILRLWWTDHGPALDLEAVFVVLEGADIEGETVLRGTTRAVREAGEATGLHLRRRIAALFRARPEAEPAGPPPAPVDPFAKLIARVKADLAAIEAFLATGAPSPRLEVSGAANVPRPSASA